PNSIMAKMLTKQVEVIEDDGKFPTKCPPDLIFFKNEYSKLIEGANRFLKKRNILPTVNRIIFITETFMFGACIFTSIILGVVCISLAVGLGVGIGSVVLCALFGVISVIASYYTGYAIMKKLERFVQSHNSDRVQIRFDTNRECIIFRITVDPTLSWMM